MSDAARAVAERVQARRRSDGGTIVAIAGPVAVGKSTLASQVADALHGHGATADVVSTDGFLFPNAVLETRGLVMRKGFPESYDVPALCRLLDTVRSGATADVPVYSHGTYDIVPGVRRDVGPLDVLVLEGVNALSATEGLVDVGVYVHAADDVVESWYVARFVALCARPDPGSFYARFAGMDRADVEALAREVNRAVNVANLREHIAPSRSLADLVVEKTADHGVGAILEGGPR